MKLSSSLVSSLVFALAVPVFAQAPNASGQQSQSIPTFHAQTELVNVPVVVTGRDGKHLTGLKKSDFVIEENGHRREIANFEEITPSTAPLQRAVVPSFQFANFVSDSGVHRSTIIVLDLVNTPYMYQEQARNKLLAFLVDHVQDTGPTSVCILGIDGLHQVHSFTSDTAILMSALQKVKSKLAEPPAQAVTSASSDAFAAPNADMEAAMLMYHAIPESVGVFSQKQQTLITLAALEQIAQAYAGIPGRKALIWASGGLPFMLNDPQSAGQADMSMLDVYERTWRALNSANIAVYSIDVHGLRIHSETHSQLQQQRVYRGEMLGATKNSASQIVLDTADNEKTSLITMANATGGKPCYNTNDLANCMELAAEDSSQYYLLSYYLPADDRKPGWHKLKVEVNVAHGDIRARDGFDVGTPKPVEQKDLAQEFDVAVNAPLDYTSVPMALTVKNITARPDGGHNVDFLLLVEPSGITIDPPNNHLDVDIGAVGLDDQGRLARVYGKSLNVNLKPEAAATITSRGFRYADAVALPPGQFRLLKLVVRDGISGKLGTITVPVNLAAATASGSAASNSGTQ